MPLFLDSSQGSSTVRFYFPSIQDQTGWQRTNPLHLLNDYDELIKITSFNYDLLNKNFVEYAISRGCMNGAGAPSPIDPDYAEKQFDLTYDAPEKIKHDIYMTRRYVRCHWLSKNKFMMPEEKIYTVQSNKKPRVLKAKEKEAIWNCIPPARARLQDCWEVWLVNYCDAVVTNFSCEPKDLTIESRNHTKNRQELSFR